jgi:hypothetical protein
VTFPAGSIEGDVRSVAVSALGDQLVEGAPETVKLGLRNAVGGAVRSPSAFTATLDDVDFATIQFATPASATPDESSTLRNVTIALSLPAGVTLGVAASAQVSDAGTGTATSGADYAAFTPQTITFPAGSLDGATQTVAVQVIDDATIELNESVQLSLSAPTAGTVVGAMNLHQLTITDDDASGSSALVASEGPTGVENPLAYDALIDLGSQSVGAGPNAGTRVRISNVGGSPMSLGAPSLTGTNVNDFAVEVEVAPLPPPNAGSGADLAPAPDVAAPLVALPAARGPGIAFRLDPRGLTRLLALPRAKMHGFPVPGLGGVTLDLHRVPLPIAEDAVLRVDGADVAGGLRAALGDLSLWSGSVVGLPGSRAFLALSSRGSRGFLELPFAQDRFVHLVSEDRSSTPGAPVVCRVLGDGDLAAMGFVPPAEFCAGARFPPGGSATPALAPTTTSGTDTLTVADCRVAIETDYQLFQKFGSIPAATNYITQLMAAVSNQYFTDVQTTLSIAYLGLYTNAADPWTSQDSGGNASNLLDEFVGAWAPSSWPVPANLAHFISGANLGGGIAYIDVLCNQGFGFGVSGNIDGTINWGGWTGQPGSFTWDFVVVAHEIGHNFGALHTHSYCPPLDQCYANCSGTTICSQGTIMSYCHLCGGMDNIDLNFHPVVANIMRQTVNSSCLGLSALAGGDYVQYLVRFNPLTSTGARNANLEFSHDATNAPQPFRIRLRGTAN